MSKISLVGSFNLAHGYLGAAEALRRLGHEVHFVPAAKYFSESKTASIFIDSIINDLKKQDPDIVLWWRAEHLNAEQLASVKNSIPGKHILYSWDDPFQFEAHREMPGKCKILDVAFTCCMSSVDDYKKYGCDAYYCLPGFDPEVHYPEESEEHKCDISIVCTNLYEDGRLTKYTHMSRKSLLDLILKHFPDVDLRIYGPESFKGIYPNHYKGWIPFEESRKVFYNSKINLDTHIRPDGYLYLNERVGQIMGSGGLLFVDPVNGIEEIFERGKECIIIDLNSEDDFKNQINDILNNKERYDEIRENGYKIAMERFTWDSWAKTIVKGMGI